MIGWAVGKMLAVKYLGGGEDRSAESRMAGFQGYTGIHVLSRAAVGLNFTSQTTQTSLLSRASIWNENIPCEKRIKCR